MSNPLFMSASLLMEEMKKDTVVNDLFQRQLAAHILQMQGWPTTLTDEQINDRMSVVYYLFFLQGIKVGAGEAAKAQGLN